MPADNGERLMAELMCMAPRHAVIFECVGLPGMLQALIDGASPGAQIVVVGVCMETDHIEPALAITKAIDLRFAYGYSQAEFAQALHYLAEGVVKADQFITAIVDLPGTASAFAELARPAAHIKIIVAPG